jgi:hypothetical protein
MYLFHYRFSNGLITLCSVKINQKNHYLYNLIDPLQRNVPMVTSSTMLLVSVNLPLQVASRPDRLWPVFRC